MASPTQPISRAQTPIVPFVHMASPEPLRFCNDLTSIEVDHILALVGTPVVTCHLRDVTLPGSTINKVR